MSYIASQYNYATPISSVASLTDEQVAVADKKYFSLSDNVLDGSYFPIEGDVGLWGAHVSSSDGSLDVHFVITVSEALTINAFRLVGSQYSYPVAFTVHLYSGSTVLYTINETANTNYEYVHYLPRTINVTKYTITITKLNRAGVQARVYNAYNPGYVKRVDTARTRLSTWSDASSLHEILRPDSIRLFAAAEYLFTNAANADDSLSARLSSGVVFNAVISAADDLTVTLPNATSIQNTIQGVTDNVTIASVDASHIENTLACATDALHVYLREHLSHVINTVDATDTCPTFITSTISAELTNIHNIMKQPSRHIFGKVYVTYTDPMLATETSLSASDTAYNSNMDQLLDNVMSSDAKLFTLYDNDLSGQFVVGDYNSQVGWVSEQLSDDNGNFSGIKPYIRLEFSERPVRKFQIIFDDSHGSVAKDFTIEYIQKSGSVTTQQVTNNSAASVSFDTQIADVVAINITFDSVTKPGHPVAVLDIPTLSTYLYVGYRDASDLISIDLLEELTYDDAIEALGGVSANEVTVSIDNSDGMFYFNNDKSPIATSLLRNRKIEPWLGIEIEPGEIEWYAMGTFWSYSWDVPVGGLYAKVVGFDTIGLLDTTDFRDHQVQVGKSVGQLLEYVLNDAKKLLSFIEYKIDDALYDIIIPYAWFEAKSHSAALRKISKCFPMHIYCDRNGAICAAPQKLNLDYYYDTWSDSTNVISKKYSSLYTVLPNVISVEVKNPVEALDDRLIDDTLTFNVAQINTRTLNFNRPYVSDITVTVDCDSTVSYTYVAYSWGIVLNFTGSGNVRSIKCSGTVLDVSRTSTISRRDDDSIRINGAVTRDISSDFIQTSDHALLLINRLESLSEQDKYDVEVEYRGDISLTINDPIHLLDGIAPDNKYNIRRHKLFWDGSLRGSAHLNT